ncbi:MULTISPECIES: hypothetical protein [Pseudomonas]|uniref:Uncharacterized protein n=1 Tax=Pseudomonas quercus TaxID=2722792 RepID=A0ABX0YD85_9PSED|nr:MULTISPECIES: hypothetical protein [Pseudomonas]MBF7141800.1 hypothetical protein [Pseudomonas sp. LY10J]NJP00339.1 hypothetical protein [Pseudomonas quercus]
MPTSCCAVPGLLLLGFTTALRLLVPQVAPGFAGWFVNVASLLIQL